MGRVRRFFKRRVERKGGQENRHGDRDSDDSKGIKHEVFGICVRGMGS